MGETTLLRSRGPAFGSGYDFQGRGADEGPRRVSQPQGNRHGVENPVAPKATGPRVVTLLQGNQRGGPSQASYPVAPRPVTLLQGNHSGDRAFRSRAFRVPMPCAYGAYRLRVP